MLMSSFLAAGIKIADLISNLGAGLDGGYLACLSQICDVCQIISGSSLVDWLALILQILALHRILW